MPAKKKSAPKGGAENAPVKITPAAVEGVLFERVAGILDEARANVVRAVNRHMVLAYWLIGREIVQALQGGEERAEYGRELMDDLSQKLKQRYGRGFSTTNLRYFRTFYLTYASRVPEIRHIRSGESDGAGMGHIGGPQFEPQAIQHIGCGVLADMTEAVEQVDATRGFSMNLGWSHYRALMKVEHRVERLFYEIEAAKAGWDVETLERQIHTFLFARLLIENTQREAQP